MGAVCARARPQEVYEASERKLQEDSTHSGLTDRIAITSRSSPGSTSGALTSRGPTEGALEYWGEEDIERSMAPLTQFDAKLVQRMRAYRDLSRAVARENLAAIMVEMGVVKVLCDMLRRKLADGERPRILQLLATIMRRDDSRLSYDYDLRSLITPEADRNIDEETASYAIAVALTDTSEDMQRRACFSVLSTVVDDVRNPFKQNEYKLKPILLLANIARCRDCHKAMGAAGVVEALTALVDHPLDELKRAAAEALVPLLRLRSLRARALRGRAVPKAQTLLCSPNLDVVAAGCHLCAVLARDSATHDAMAPLLPLLFAAGRHPDVLARRAAAHALCLVAQSERYRTPILLGDGQHYVIQLQADLPDGVDDELRRCARLLLRPDEEKARIAEEERAHAERREKFAAAARAKSRANWGPPPAASVAAARWHKAVTTVLATVGGRHAKARRTVTGTLSSVVSVGNAVVPLEGGQAGDELPAERSRHRSLFGHVRGSADDALVDGVHPALLGDEWGGEAKPQPGRRPRAKSLFGRAGAGPEDARAAAANGGIHPALIADAVAIGEGPMAMPRLARLSSEPPAQPPRSRLASLSAATDSMSSGPSGPSGPASEPLPAAAGGARPSPVRENDPRQRHASVSSLEPAPAPSNRQRRPSVSSGGGGALPQVTSGASIASAAFTSNPRRASRAELDMPSPPDARRPSLPGPALDFRSAAPASPLPFPSPIHAPGTPGSPPSPQPAFAGPLAAPHPSAFARALSAPGTSPRRQSLSGTPPADLSSLQHAQSAPVPPPLLPLLPPPGAPWLSALPVHSRRSSLPADLRPFGPTPLPQPLAGPILAAPLPPQFPFLPLAHAFSGGPPPLPFPGVYPLPPPSPSAYPPPSPSAYPPPSPVSPGSPGSPQGYPPLFIPGVRPPASPVPSGPAPLPSTVPIASRRGSMPAFGPPTPLVIAPPAISSRRQSAPTIAPMNVAVVGPSPRVGLWPASPPAQAPGWGGAATFGPPSPGSPVSAFGAQFR